MARINRNSQNDEDQMSTNDPNGRENFIKRKSFALGASNLRLRRCHRLPPPSPRLRRAKEEAHPPLAQRAEALPKIHARQRSWDKAAMHVWAHYHRINAGFFHGRVLV